jgi:ABC-type antimicrobial peptide transport system permease subunit
LGFDQDMIVTIPLPENSPRQRIALKTGLLRNSQIQNVSYGFTPPMSGSVWGTSFIFPKKNSETQISVHVKMADSAYLSTYGIKLIAGKNLDDSDTVNAVIINNTLAQLLSDGDPNELLGEEISMWGRNLPIVGIVNDFHATSLRETIKPVIIANQGYRLRMAGIKISSNNIPETLNFIENLWKVSFPEHVYSYQFLDESLAQFYDGQQRMSRTLIALALIAIFLSALGLYGLVSYMVNNKTKEVGIRKALGASVSNILTLFMKEFFILVIIAFVLAGPVGYLSMNSWLADFAYRIPFAWWIFAFTLAGTLLITIITVGYRSAMAAKANPVDSLRTE